MTTRVCSSCRFLRPEEAFYSPTHYDCRACRLERARERYRASNGTCRAYRMRIPEGFAERAGKEWDTALGEHYGVSYKTIQRWRRTLGIPPKDRAPHMAAWGQMGNAVARELHPERMTGYGRTRKANAAHAAREAEADKTGITRPTIRTPLIGDDRELLKLVLRALATSPPLPVWEREEFA